MKTIKNQILQKLTAGSLSLIFLLGTVSSYASVTKTAPKNATESEKELIANLKKEFEFNTEIPGESLKTYRIYDTNDNLIHEVSLDVENKEQDNQLIKYLLKADLVMEYGNTKYYKIN